MKELRSLKAICRSDWYAKAYSEYLKDVNNQFGLLIIYFQECLNIDEEQLASITSESLHSDIYQLVDHVWSEFSSANNPEFVNTANVSIPNIGYVSIRDIGYGLIKYIYQSDDPDSDLIIEIGNGGPTIEYQVFASHFVDVNTNSTVLQIAYETLSAIPDASPADKVDLFINKVSGSVSTVRDSSRDIFNYYKELIFNNSSIEEFTEVISNVSGITDVADQEDNVNTTNPYDQCDMSKYTGSTPGIALDFSSVKGAVSTAINVGAKVVKGIFGAVKKGASWLFKKASKIVNETIVDPAICQYLDPDTNKGLFDGFAFNQVLVTNQNTIPSYAAQDLIGPVNIWSQFNHYAGSWIKLETKLGELLFKPEPLVQPEPVGYASIYWKPAAIDVDYLLSNVSDWPTISPSISNSTAEFMNDMLNFLEKISDYIIPLGKDATKYQILRGIVFSNQMIQCVANIAFIEAYTTIFPNANINVSDIYITASNFKDAIRYNLDASSPGVGDVTNANLIKAIAGPVGTNPDLLLCYMDYDESRFKISESTINSQMTLGYSARLLMLAWMISRYDRTINPINYMFIPYSNNTSSFSNPSWRVKSDQEIADTRDNFIETAIVVAVIAAVVITTGVAISKIKKKAFFKRKAFLDKMEQKSWAGEPLSPAEKRKYIRYSRKQSSSNLLDPFSTDSVSQSSIDPNTGEYDDSFTSLEALIR